MAVLLAIFLALIGSIMVAGVMIQGRRKVAAAAALAAPPVAWGIGSILGLRLPELLYSSMLIACAIGSICLVMQRRWLTLLFFAIPPLALGARTFMGDRNLHLDHQMLFSWVRAVSEFGAVFAPVLLSLAAVFLVGTFVERRTSRG